MSPSVTTTTTQLKGHNDRRAGAEQGAPSRAASGSLVSRAATPPPGAPSRSKTPVPPSPGALTRTPSATSAPTTRLRPSTALTPHGAHPRCTPHGLRAHLHAAFSASLSAVLRTYRCSQRTARSVLAALDARLRAMSLADLRRAAVPVAGLTLITAVVMGLASENRRLRHELHACGMVHVHRIVSSTLRVKHAILDLSELTDLSDSYMRAPILL